MRIQDNHPISGVRKNKKKSGASGSAGGSFAALINDGADTTVSQANALMPLGSLDGLLAMQEVDNKELLFGKRRQHGESLLEHLEMLRLDFLSGKVPVHRVQQLISEVRKEHEKTDDPVLEDAIKDIEIRAEVELAKLEMARQQQK